MILVPDPEEFTKLIHQHVKRYRELDRTYLKAIEFNEPN
jgi:hypothetical protein